MKRLPRLLLLISFAAALPATLPLAQAAEIRVAVAANFSATVKPLITQFEHDSGHTVLASFGASGKFYTQIHQGAPFDLFLSADSSTPQKLADEGLASAASLRTYAIGQLMLWSAKNDFIDAQGKILQTDRFRHLALAQPKLAPYGLAAQQVMENLHLWDKLQPKLVFGENISQTQQFIDSGNAELGFIALSQLPPGNKGSVWRVPDSLYAPIRQQMVILNAAQNKAAVSQFWQFLQSPAAQNVIRASGYRSGE